MDNDIANVDGERRVFTVKEDDEGLNDAAEPEMEDERISEHLKVHARITSDLSQLRVSPTPSQIRDNTASPFKARPMPKVDADVQPRMSRAAALRLGLEDPKHSTKPKSSESNEPTVIDMITPGVNQRPLTEAEMPKSLAAPMIAPRQTRASAFRTGRESTTPQSVQKKRETRDTSQRSQGYEGLPGFKRKSSISSFSPAPIAEVKPTRASLLRQGKDSTAPRPRTAMATITAKVAPTSTSNSNPRRQSIDSGASTRPPSIQPRPTRTSQLRCGVDTAASKTPTTRRSSIESSKSNTTVDSHSTKTSKQDIFIGSK